MNAGQTLVPFVDGLEPFSEKCGSKIMILGIHYAKSKSRIVENCVHKKVQNADAKGREAWLFGENINGNLDDSVQVLRSVMNFKLEGRSEASRHT